MVPFDFQSPTRFVFGRGRIAELGPLASAFDVRRVLVVSDAGVVAAGHTDRALASLAAADLETTLFADVHENPTTDDVDAGLERAREFRPELLVAVGGGSSMDCAKGINFLYSCGGRMQDYWGIGKATGPMLPLVAVPTTAGTGSEAQSFALISDAQSQAKMACGDKRAACRVALLDPELTRTQPESVTALTGVDALSHALETYVTSKRNTVSLAFSREAWRQLAANFSRVLEEPGDLEARAGMQLGACFAGLAIENSMLGATHALANPLTARYRVPHGQAIALMLPHVIRFNGASQPVAGWYEELLVEARLAGALTASDVAGPRGSEVEQLAAFTTRLIDQAGLHGRLRAHGVERERLPELAEEAAQQWTGTFNPRPVDAPQLLAIYEQAF